MTLSVSALVILAGFVIAACSKAEPSPDYSLVQFDPNPVAWYSEKMNIKMGARPVVTALSTLAQMQVIQKVDRGYLIIADPDYFSFDEYGFNLCMLVTKEDLAEHQVLNASRLGAFGGLTSYTAVNGFRQDVYEFILLKPAQVAEVAAARQAKGLPVPQL